MNLLLSCHLVTILKTANCIAPDCHKPPCIKCERMLCVVQLVHTEEYCCLPHAFSIVSPVTTYGPRISEFLHLSITFPFVAPHSSISARWPSLALLRTPSQHLISLCGPTLEHLSLLVYMYLLLSCHLVTILKATNCIAPDRHKPPCIKCERMLCVVQLVHTEVVVCLMHLVLSPPVNTYGPHISEFLHLSITFPFVTPHSSISAHWPSLFLVLHPSISFPSVADLLFFSGLLHLSILSPPVGPHSSISARWPSLFSGLLHPSISFPSVAPHWSISTHWPTLFSGFLHPNSHFPLSPNGQSKSLSVRPPQSGGGLRVDL